MIYLKTCIRLGILISLKLYLALLPAQVISQKDFKSDGVIISCQRSMSWSKKQKTLEIKA